MTRRLLHYAAAALVALLLSAPPYAAYAARPAARAQGAVLWLVAERRTAVSPDQAVAAALRAVPGRVLAASRVERGGRLLYRVKILTRRGVVRVVYVDAYSGRVL